MSPSSTPTTLECFDRDGTVGKLAGTANWTVTPANAGLSIVPDAAGATLQIAVPPWLN